MDNAERVEGSAGYKPPPIPRHEGALPAASAGKTERIIGPDESDITVHFQGSPTWETYDFLEQYIKLRKAVLKRSAAGASSQTQDESAKAQGEQEGS